MCCIQLACLLVIRTIQLLLMQESQYACPSRIFMKRHVIDYKTRRAVRRHRLSDMRLRGLKPRMSCDHHSGFVCKFYKHCKHNNKNCVLGSRWTLNFHLHHLQPTWSTHPDCYLSFTLNYPVSDPTMYSSNKYTSRVTLSYFMIQ